MPEREAVPAQGGVGLREPDSGLEHGHARALVDREHALQPPEIERDQRTEAPALALQAADDARAAAERHDRDALLGARAQHRRERVDVAGRDDRVRRGLAVPGPLGEQVEVGLAAAAQHARLAVVTQLGQRGQPLAERRRQRGGRQRDVLERDRRRHALAGDAQLGAQQRGGMLSQRRSRPGLAPAPEDLLAPHSESYWISVWTS